MLSDSLRNVRKRWYVEEGATEVEVGFLAEHAASTAPISVENVIGWRWIKNERPADRRPITGS
eukprot:scaffold17100_cov105-Skeletonema_dohrnii-CCMP3373.AAC.1